MQTKVCLVRAMIFPVVIHVWIWKLDYKENWVLKNWCFWTEVLEKTLDSPLDCKEIQPVHPKGNQSWIFIGRTDAEVEAPILWPPDVKNWLIGKDPDAGKDWRQEEKGITEDEMLGWHRWLDGHEFEQALGVGDAQGSLVHHSPWDHKESDTTKWLNWTAVYIEIHISFWTSIFVFFFSDTHLGMELLSHMIVLFLVFEPPSYLIQWLHQFTFPPTVSKHSLFSTFLPAFVMLGLFGRCQVISHCVFYLQS